MIEVPYSDIEFYERKIMRLQTDVATLAQQLMIAKHKVVQAQERQIKCLQQLKQTEINKSRLSLSKNDDVRNEDIAIKRIIQLENESKQKLDDLQRNLRQHYEQIIEDLRSQKAPTQQKRKFEQQPQSTEKYSVLQFKLNKAVTQRRQAVRQLENYRQKTQKQRTNQLQSLRESLTVTLQEKQENDRKFYREQIQKLQKSIENLQNELSQEKMKTNPARENQIHRLRQETIKIQSRNVEQLEKLQGLVANKNQQIKKLQQMRKNLERELIEQRKDSRQRVKNLQNQLINQQKNARIQISGTMARLNLIHQGNINELQKQIRQAGQDFFNERKSWQQIMEQKEQEVQRYKKAWDDQKLKGKQDKEFYKSKINELNNRLKEYEDPKSRGQTQRLLASLREINENKQHFDNYANGITFLQRQVKKSLLKLQVKNKQVKGLLQELNSLRQEFNKEKQYYKEKYDEQRITLNDRIVDLETKIMELQDLLKQKDIHSKLKVMQEDSDRAKLETQNRVLKDLNQELKRDYNRVVENKKEVQKDQRQEREQAIHSKSEIHFTKREKWLELERQKNQLEVIFKEKQEQLRMAHQVERDRLRNKNLKLVEQNQLLKQAVDQANLKISQYEGDQPKEDRLTQYNKKVASLNLEIALTQNIYKQLIQVKSKNFQQREQGPFQLDEIKSQSSPVDSDREREPIEGSEQNDNQESPAFKARDERDDFLNFGADSFGPMKLSPIAKRRSD